MPHVAGDTGGADAPALNCHALGAIISLLVLAAGDRDLEDRRTWDARGVGAGDDGMGFI